MNTRPILVTYMIAGWFVKANLGNSNASSTGKDEISSGDINRQKRYLIWETSGLYKLVLGFTYPVDLGDKKPWRLLSCAHNLQAQYALPTKASNWFDGLTGRSLAKVTEEYNKNRQWVADESRRLIYSLIEYYAKEAGKNGKKCLLRAICDHAEVDKMHGVWGKIIDAILTPGDYADKEYGDAYKAGKYGAICTTLYPECPEGDGIFDSLFITTKVNFVEKRGTVHYPIK